MGILPSIADDKRACTIFQIVRPNFTPGKLFLPRQYSPAFSPKIGMPPADALPPGSSPVSGRDGCHELRLKFKSAPRAFAIVSGERLRSIHETHPAVTMTNVALTAGFADCRQVRFLDLSVGDAEERRQIHDAIDTVLRHGRIVLGPEVVELERRVATRVGRKFAVGVNSGSDALVIALRALGIGPGDEVIVPALSFIATANAVSVVGATPVFADLDDQCNLDPDAIAALMTAQTKAILPVHWTGRVAAMEAILDIAQAHAVPVIEDASQAFDSSRRGRMAGSLGTIGCFSMNSMKVFASLGEAGMIVMDDAALYEQCLALRYHGMVNREYCVAIAQNSRLDTLQAAVLLVRLKSLQANIESRRTSAAYYSDRLASVVSVPQEGPDERQVYYTYTIRCDRRDELKAFLESRGIEVKIQHPLLMPQHPAYRAHARGSWSKAEQLIRNVLCLPLSERISPSDLHYVTETVLAFFAG